MWVSLARTLLDLCSGPLGSPTLPLLPMSWFFTCPGLWLSMVSGPPQPHLASPERPLPLARAVSPTGHVLRVLPGREPYAQLRGYITVKTSLQGPEGPTHLPSHLQRQPPLSPVSLCRVGHMWVACVPLCVCWGPINLSVFSNQGLHHVLHCLQVP